MQSPSQLIRYHISHGNPKEAFLIYNRTRHNGIDRQAVFPLLLKASASLSFHRHGKSLHADSIKSGVVSNVMIGTSLVTMYAKCQNVVDSRKVFDEMPEKNVVTWNAMVGAYSRIGNMGYARFLFEKMPMKATSVTWSEMIDGYARNGDIIAARCLFDQTPIELKNVVIWTVMVDGYVRNGDIVGAREVFEEMPERNCYVWSSMIAGYFKKGKVEEARDVFDQIAVRNMVNWNALITGYVQNGLCQEGIEAFGRMQDEGFEPDEVTATSLLSACAQLGSLDIGKEIHELINRKGIKHNVFVLNGLVHMYAKCGDLSNARSIFDVMLFKNDACWNAMISGLAVHGESEQALKLFYQLERSLVKPNGVTFLCVLAACTHGGFVKEGLEIFSRMKEKYALVAGIEHYGCVVDLLGRAGRLKEAYELIKTMPMKPNDVVWGSFLGACRVHSDTQMVERVVAEIGVVDFNMATGDDSRYVLLSNIYAASDRWEKAEQMRTMMVNDGFQKSPGCSSITVGSN